MRFLLYNIRYATGGWPGRALGFFRRTHNHLLDIVEFLRAQEADVAGLVEVDSGSYRTRRRNQAEFIAEALGHYHTFGVKYGRTSMAHAVPVMRKQGNAFLVRDTDHSARFHYFERGVKRLVIELETDRVVFFLVHLALGAKVRHHQLHHLYTLIKQTAKPCIVAGDFNTLWGETEIQLFIAACGLQNADPQIRPSYPSWAPKRHLDFIMHSPEIRVRDFRMPAVTLSDHLPLVCDFDIAADG